MAPDSPTGASQHRGVPPQRVASPISYEGLELHNSDTREFHRMVRKGDTILHRFGAQGTEGETRKEPFLTERIAAEAYLRQFQDCISGTWTRPYVLNPTPARIPEATIHSHEQLFLNRWAREAVTLVGGDHLPHEWILCTGLLAEQRFDHGAAAIVDHLTSRPHAIDYAQDRIVGQAGPLCRSGGVWYRSSTAPGTDYLILGATTHWTAASLGPFDPQDQTRVAELLVGLATNTLATGDTATRQRLVNTARRLARDTELATTA